MFGGYGAKALGQTGLDVGAALAAGFAPSVGDVVGRLAGNLASPGSMAGLAGSVAAKAAGFTGPTGVMGRVAQAFNPAVTIGLGLMNPLAALGYTALSPFAMDALGDATNSRRDERHRDALENAHGTFGGRTAARDFDSLAAVGGFGTLGKMAADYGYGPADLARGMSNRDASKAMAGRNPSGSSYGGWGSAGGPVDGARAVDSAYGRSMGGWAAWVSATRPVTAAVADLVAGTPGALAPMTETAIRQETPDSADNHNSPGNRALHFWHPENTGSFQV